MNDLSRIECRRCPRTIADVAPGMPGGVLCDDCVIELRDNAAIAGGIIASRFDPAADHRSPGERLRED